MSSAMDVLPDDIREKLAELELELSEGKKTELFIDPNRSQIVELWFKTLLRFL